MTDNAAYCENLVREADKDRFLATLFAPADRRPALFALYAFNIEIARVREGIRDPMAGEIRLQWWRDAIESGAREAAAHPVAAALRNAIEHFRLPIAPLLDLIEARSFDLYDDPMPTLTALEGYAAKTSSVLIQMAATILDASQRETLDSMRSAGMAHGIVGLLWAFPAHAGRGQLYVPLDVLARHHAVPDDALAGRDTPQLRAALAEMRQHARRHFDAYQAAAATISRAAAPAFLPVALVPLYLDRLERARDAPFAILDVAQWRRQWTLWRASRRM
jgi:phytoene synthase